MSFNWWGYLGGIVTGVAIYKLISSIYASRKVLLIEKKRLHWILSDQLTRHEEMVTMHDGTQLQGYIYESIFTPAKAPAVLFLHGMGGFAQDFNFEPMLSAIAIAGYRVFAYDYRASGRSRKKKEPTIFGSLTTTFVHKLFEDPKYALDWVLSHENVDANHIAVMGASLGATIALSEILHDPRIKMIVAVCAPHDIGENIQKLLFEGPWLFRTVFKLMNRRLWKEKEGDRLMKDAVVEKFSQLSPSSQIRPDYDYTKRVFLVHSETDEILPFYLNFPQNVSKMRLPPTQTFVVKRGGHELKGQEAAVMSRVVSWLKQYL